MKKLFMAAAAGILVGILTLIGQKYLPINLNFLANSGAVWLIPAYLLSFFRKDDAKSSILTAIFCLLGCVYGYYVFEAIYNQHAFSLGGGVLVWSVVALLAGFVFGLGAYWANAKSSWVKYCGMNLLPAVFTAEGIDHLLHLADYSHMIPAVILKLVIGIALYMIINGKQSLSIRSLAAYTGISAVGVLGYTVLGSGVLI